jgi:hypothetical protein
MDEGGKHTGKSEVKERVQVFLGEFRIIIPAMAALFGFQLTTAFHDSFSKLSRLDQAVNFVGVACTAATILFLLVPASYHRFVREQEESEDFLHFARRCVDLAFVAMPLGIAAAMYLQGLKSFHSHAAAAVTAVAVLGAFVAAWWVMPRSRAVEQGLAHGQEDEARPAGDQHRLAEYGLRDEPTRPVSFAQEEPVGPMRTRSSRPRPPKRGERVAAGRRT